jgi:L-rhamnose-H+ transport protein
LHPEKVFTTGGLFTFAGVALVLIGVGICAIAGRRREAAMAVLDGRRKANMSRGLAFAILCGFGAALVNFGLAFGGPLLQGARKHGAAEVWAGNAVWLPLMLAGSIPNFAYCVYLLSKNKTVDRYTRLGTASYWFLAAIMAFFWFASTALYGIATGKLGSWGTILGWPLFMSLIVITASLLGIMTGEWKGSGKLPLRTQVGGVVVLVLAVFVLAAASRWV